MRYVPFTVYCSFDMSAATRTGYIKSAQKYATVLHTQLSTLTNINIAGSGAYLGGSATGVAYKPQFGNLPAQFQITGFNHVETANAPPYASQTEISANDWHTGYSSPTNVKMPTSTINTEVKALRTLFMDAIDDSIPNINAKVYKIIYSGVVFGHMGFHFPE